MSELHTHIDLLARGITPTPASTDSWPTEAATSNRRVIEFIELMDKNGIKPLSFSLPPFIPSYATIKNPLHESLTPTPRKFSGWRIISPGESSTPNWALLRNKRVYCVAPSNNPTSTALGSSQIIIPFANPAFRHILESHETESLAGHMHGLDILAHAAMTLIEACEEAPVFA